MPRLSSSSSSSLLLVAVLGCSLLASHQQLFASATVQASDVAGGTLSTHLVPNLSGSACANSHSLQIEGSLTVINFHGLYTTGTVIVRDGSAPTSTEVTTTIKAAQQLGAHKAYIFLPNKPNECAVEVTLTVTCPTGSLPRDSSGVGDVLTTCLPGAMQSRSSSSMFSQFYTGKHTRVQQVTPHGNETNYDQRQMLIDAAMLVRAADAINLKPVSAATFANMPTFLDTDMPPIVVRSGNTFSTNNTVHWMSVNANVKKCVNWTFTGNAHLVVVPRVFDFGPNDATGSMYLEIYNNNIQGVNQLVNTATKNGLSGTQKAAKSTSNGHMAPFYVTGAGNTRGFSVSFLFCIDRTDNTAKPYADSDAAGQGFEMLVMATNATTMGGAEAKAEVMDRLVTNGHKDATESMIHTTGTAVPFDLQTGFVATMPADLLVHADASSGSGRRLLSDSSSSGVACSGYRYVPVLSRTPLEFDVAEYFKTTGACGIVPRLADSDSRRGRRAVLVARADNGRLSCPVVLPRRSRVLWRQKVLLELTERHRITNTSLQMVEGPEHAEFGRSLDAGSAECRAVTRDVNSLILSDIIKMRQKKEEHAQKQQQSQSSSSSSSSNSKRRLLSASSAPAITCDAVPTSDGSEAGDALCFGVEEQNCMVEDTGECVEDVWPSCYDNVADVIQDELEQGYINAGAYIDAAGHCHEDVASTYALQPDAEAPCNSPIIVALLLECQVEAGLSLFQTELGVAQHFVENVPNSTSKQATLDSIQTFLTGINKAENYIQKSIQFEFHGPKLDQQITVEIKNKIAAATNYGAHSEITTYDALKAAQGTNFLSATLTHVQKTTVLAAATKYAELEAALKEALREVTLSKHVHKRIAARDLGSQHPLLASMVVVYEVCSADSLFQQLDFNFVPATFTDSTQSPKCATGGAPWVTFKDVFAMAAEGSTNATSTAERSSFVVPLSGKFKLARDYTVDDAVKNKGTQIAGLSVSNFGVVPGKSSAKFTLEGTFVTTPLYRTSVPACPPNYNVNSAKTSELKMQQSKGTCWNSHQSNISAVRDYASMTSCSCPALKPLTPDSDSTTSKCGLPVAGPPGLVQYERCNSIVFYSSKEQEWMQVYDLICQPKAGTSVVAQKPEPPITDTEIVQRSCSQHCAVSKNTYKKQQCCAAAAAAAAAAAP